MVRKQSIVCHSVPQCSTQVLVIDPFKEISKTLQNNFRQYPQDLPVQGRVGSPICEGRRGM